MVKTNYFNYCYYVNNLYNFPNPFKDNTFFTFYLSKYPADVEINIYTINGQKLKTIQAYCDNYYNSLKWNGKTDTGTELGNGPYIYSFKSFHVYINSIRSRSSQEEIASQRIANGLQINLLMILVFF